MSLYEDVLEAFEKVDDDGYVNLRSILNKICSHRSPPITEHSAV